MYSEGEIMRMKKDKLKSIVRVHSLRKKTDKYITKLSKKELRQLILNSDWFKNQHNREELEETDLIRIRELLELLNARFNATI